MADNTQGETPYIFSQEDWRVLDSLEVRNLGALEGITDDMNKQIIRELTDGLNAGEGMAQLSKRIQTATGMAETRATTMARTETINAAVDGTRVRYEQAGITQFEYIAATDERTCGECAKHNGKIYDLDDNANMPPLHPNCRCAIAPIIGNRKQEILDAQKRREKEAAEKARLEAELKKKREAEKKKEEEKLKKAKAEKERAERIKNEEKKREEEAKEIAEKIRNTKDHKELQDIIHKVWSKDIKFTPAVKKLDFEGVKNNFEATARVVGDIPEIKTYLRKVTSVKETGLMSVCPADRTIIMNINPQYFSPETVTKTKARYSVEIEEGVYWHPFGTTWEDVMSHEFGHIVEYAIIEKRYGGADEWLTRSTKWRACTIAREIIETATKRVTKSKKVSESDMLDEIKKISKYAVYNETPWSEAMAEAFADYYSNGDLAKEISKEIIYASKEMLHQ